MATTEIAKRVSKETFTGELVVPEPQPFNFYSCWQAGD